MPNANQSISLTSLKLSMAWNVALPPPMITTPFPDSSVPELNSFGERDISSFVVLLGSAET